jgi:hypothetical protein
MFGHKSRVGVFVGTMDVTDRMMEYLRKSPDGRVIKYAAPVALPQLNPSATLRSCHYRSKLRARCVSCSMCGSAGRITQLGPELQASYRALDLTRESLMELSNAYVGAIAHGTDVILLQLEHRSATCMYHAGTYLAQGWSPSMYAVSKLAEIAYTFMVAREEATLCSGVIVNAVCPG